MGRTIRAGDEVLIEPANKPRLGEVWAFCDEEAAIVVHRYVIQTSKGFWFQGDASGALDRPVPPEYLVGRVVAVVRGGLNIDRDGVWTRLVGWILALRRLGVATLRRFRRHIRG